jgi:hypothetical protein
VSPWAPPVMAKPSLCRLRSMATPATAPAASPSRC